MDFQEGDLLRIKTEHQSLPVDGATLRYTGDNGRYGMAKYLIPHPTYGEREVYFTKFESHVEKL